MPPILDRLLHRYHTDWHPEAYHTETGGMPGLVANDQHPEALIVSCIDSRCAPGVIFQMQPGEALDHSHIAALVPEYNPYWEDHLNEVPSIAASIDFAVAAKQVDCVIVMGHTHCGGIKACVDGTSSALIQAWMKHALPALKDIKMAHRDPEVVLRRAEQECVKQSLRNLQTYPAVQAAMRDRDLVVEGWLNDLEGGNLYRYDPVANNFKNLRP